MRDCALKSWTISKFCYRPSLEKIEVLFFFLPIIPLGKEVSDHFIQDKTRVRLALGSLLTRHPSTKAVQCLAEVVLTWPTQNQPPVPRYFIKISKKKRNWSFAVLLSRCLSCCVALNSFLNHLNPPDHYTLSPVFTVSLPQTTPDYFLHCFLFSGTFLLISEKIMTSLHISGWCMSEAQGENLASTTLSRKFGFSCIPATNPTTLWKSGLCQFSL